MIALALLLVQATEPSPPDSDEIIVQAVRQKCDMRFRNKGLSDRELRRHAASWAAGRPVRVVAKRDADIKCLAKIAFKLADRGVTRVHFASPGDPVVAVPEW